VEADVEFASILEEVQLSQMDFEMNFANPSDHEPMAERNNRTLGERTRVAFHRLPFQIMPRLLIKHLVYNAARHLNYFPAKGGISAYFSPNALLGHPPLDYRKHCRVVCGAYVAAQIEPDPKNSLKSRQIDAIYLSPSDSMQGGHIVLNLDTGREVLTARVTELPTTPVVIRAVNELGAHQNMNGLKFANRRGITFFPSDLLAGVDYDDSDDPDTDPDYGYLDRNDVPFQYDDEIDQEELNELEELNKEDMIGQGDTPGDMNEDNDADDPIEQGDADADIAEEPGPASETEQDDADAYTQSNRLY
jgi:hypothetical protein